jgi:hypothetical protein
MNNQEDYFEYLDNLRESGVTNMYGAVPYLQREFPELDKDLAKHFLLKWMRTFAQRRSA